MKSDKNLALITARGSSKGLPRKNILHAFGKPLIAWTIEAALKSTVIDQVVLSSEDDEIIETAKAWGCSVPFRRPDHLASDTTSSMDVIMHALEHLPGFDHVILLQPTSPLRTALDIDTAFEQLKTSCAPCCVSVSEVEQSPYWMYHLEKKNILHCVLPLPTNAHRRQDLPPVYVLNGAIYIARVDWLKKTKSFISDETVGYVMSQVSSIDIDTAEDFEAFRLRVETIE
jgi:CMP-N,N'-diacetyllegionaminic acid synthase